MYQNAGIKRNLIAYFKMLICKEYIFTSYIYLPDSAFLKRQKRIQMVIIKIIFWLALE